MKSRDIGTSRRRVLDGARSIVCRTCIVALLVMGSASCAQGTLTGEESNASSGDASSAPSLERPDIWGGASPENDVNARDGRGAPSDQPPSGRDGGCSGDDCIRDVEPSPDRDGVQSPDRDATSPPNLDTSTSDTGTPSDTDPQAPDTPCREFNCAPNGTCELSQFGTATCSCDSGYVPYEKRCISDPCRGEDCNGHGTCRVEGPGQASCDCESGYQSQGATCRPIDSDGDGTIAPNDCDDQDPDRAPSLSERCDGKDNDCDNRIDEDLRQDCPLQQGVCGQPVEAVKTCRNGQWTSCTDAYGPNYESDETSCDGRDNDCDGQIDEASQCTGSSSCHQVIRCSNLCSSPNRQSCRRQAYFNGTSAAQASYDRLGNCTRSNNCNTLSCFQQNCPAAYDSCYGPTGDSNLSCSEHLRCQLSCPNNSSRCIQDCFSRTPGSEKQKVRNYISCVNNNCANATDATSCIRTNCRPEAETCFGCQ